VNSNARSGVILLTVLWTIALLATLAMATSLTFRSFTGIMAVDRDRLKADALLSAGLEVAAGLASSAGDIPLRDVESSVSLSSGTVRFRLEDEGGRIDIGKAPVEVLAALLRSVGATDVDAVAHAIVEWRKVDQDAGKGTPPAGAAPAASATPTAAAPAAAAPAATKAASAPNAATPAPPSLFTDVSQLLQVAGMRPQWVAAVAPLVTVFGSETVNPLTAPAAVLAALPGIDQTRLAAFLDARALTSDPKQLVAGLGAAQTYLDAKPAQAVSVKLTAVLADGYAAAAQAVIVCLPKDRQPYRVLVWTPVPPVSPAG
jgi:general secretion pathway protein K